MADYGELELSKGLGELGALVVDDNEHMRTLLTAVLKAFGITNVRQAKNATEAATHINRTVPDFAIVDYLMPPDDGIEFVKEIRKSNESIRYLPIVLVTSYAERECVERARDAGVTEFLVKPITPKSVFRRIEEIVIRPRPFIDCDTYFGPDRRRRADPNFPGPFRRVEDQAKTDDDDDVFEI